METGSTTAVKWMGLGSEGGELVPEDLRAEILRIPALQQGQGGQQLVAARRRQPEVLCSQPLEAGRGDLGNA